MNFDYNVNPINFGAYYQGLNEFEKRQGKKASAEQEARLQELRRRAVAGDQAAIQELAGFSITEAEAAKKFSAPKPVDDVFAREGLSDMEKLLAYGQSGSQLFAPQYQTMVQKYADTPFGQTLTQWGQQYQQDQAAAMSMLAQDVQAGRSLLAGGANNEMTAQEKNFSKLQQLRQQGRTAEADEFAKLINLKDTKKLSAASEKSLIVSTDKYFELQNAAGEAYTLAMQLEQMPFEGGVQGRMGETFRNLTGSQTAADELRKRFRAIRGSQVVKNLPPGAASDTDIQLALAGFPDDNWGSDKLQSYLRGMAKITEIEADFHRFRAEYIGENNSSAGFISEWKKYAGETYKKDNPMFRGNQQQLDAQRTLAEDEVRNMAKSKYGIDL